MGISIRIRETMENEKYYSIGCRKLSITSKNNILLYILVIKFEIVISEMFNKSSVL